MNSRRVFISMLLGAIGLIVVSGCSGTKKITNPKANERPILQLTRAPENRSTRFEYSYRMNWLGYDPDGKIAYYLYAIDPPSPTAFDPEPETTWVQTDKSERLINFSATQLDSTRPNVNGASDFHTFVVKAIDNGGLGGPLQSEPIIRSFFTYTIAPTVRILNPSPTDRGRQYVTPAVRINWTGSDDDGILDNKKPVKYKYILLTQNTPVSFQTALTTPDSVRRYYAPRNWAGWDSTTADTTEKLFTNLGVQQDYMFCVVAFDEAGAYSPVFSQNGNMLNMRVTFAAQGGPLITIFNDFFFFNFKQGIYSTDERFKIKIEVPAGEKVPFRWTATIPDGSGATLRGFRWALDIDNLDDQTPRSNELTDWKHWSQESGDITFAQVGPFPGGEIHHFYLEAVDNNNLKSLAVVKFNVVQSDFAKELLVVNDTRLKTDKRSAGATCVDAPLGTWPTSAELDTFMFARGGKDWQCYPTGTKTVPGLFSAYGFAHNVNDLYSGPNRYDTLGTRTGTSEVRVPLAVLGHYKHVIWITDQTAANAGAKGTTGTSVDGQPALTYMSDRGRANSISAYLRQGGQVWLLGGGAAYAATAPYNSRKNDTGHIYGPTFTSNPQELNPTDPLELTAGRFIYDVPHWQSQIRSTSQATTSVPRFFGRLEAPGNSPPSAYLTAPPFLRFRSAALGDVVPPLRASNVFFPLTPNVDMEYLSLENRITEDVDPDPLRDVEQSTLDTLYYVRGQTFVPTNVNLYNVCMTVYRGPAYDFPIIFSGFNIWSWTKSDCQKLVDMVMRDMWGYPQLGPQPQARLTATSRGASTPVQSVSAIPMLHIGRLPDR